MRTDMLVLINVDFMETTIHYLIIYSQWRTVCIMIWYDVILYGRTVYIGFCCALVMDNMTDLPGVTPVSREDMKSLWSYDLTTTKNKYFVGYVPMLWWSLSSII